MDSFVYQTEASATDHKSYDQVLPRLSNEETARLTHYVLGVTSESGELADALKKWIAYGKSTDWVNIKEEVGDVLWYLARIADLGNFTLGEAMEINIKKLKTRYPDKFTAERAMNRDLAAERKVLES